jgi:nucleotide-binding universal stress UspA family protein
MSARQDLGTATPWPARLQRVVVATDFSAGGARALARAARLPIAARARVALLHVLPDDLPASVRARAGARARSRLREAEARFRSLIGRRTCAIRSELCRGQPFVEIIRRARLARADLVVLGRHGRRPIRDVFIGSTASRVIRMGDVPVLIVKRSGTRGYRRPVVAVDLSDTSPLLVDLTRRILGADVASVSLVHAYHVPFEGFSNPGVGPTGTSALRQQYRQRAAADMARLQTWLGDLGTAWHATIVHGDPDAVIAAEIVRHRADLLAIGTHARSGVVHALLGSVAESLIGSATCDVLVGRPARVSFELP